MEFVCPNCGAKIPLGTEFCGECGSKVSQSLEPPPKELSFKEKIDKIQRYLPGGLTDKILAQRGKIEGERKQVTVMFCDMAGFTPIVEMIGPEEAYSIMDQVYEILIHKVHDYEGTVNEMTGDGIMALFGAPIALEGAPQRAIHSAYSIHREMTKFSDKITQKRRGLPSLKMRIGIHTGPVVVGTLGNDLRVEFKAVGDTVNLASRMEDLTEPGATYVSEDTFKLTEGLFRYESLGEKEIKGKEEPIKTYRVIGPSTRRTTPFVGKERELELLLDGFERAKQGRGQAFSIMAEAGVGKSRLLYEFRKVVSNEDITFLEGKCLSYSRGVAYYPIIDLFKSNFDIREGDEDSQIRDKVKRGLRQFDLDKASTLPYLLELLSVKDSGIDQIAMSPEARKDRMWEAMKRIPIKGSEIRPLIMAIEDLHWIDKSSEEFLKYLLESILGARILLIFSYRPEFVHTWGGKSYHNQVNLNRLSNRDNLIMVSHLLGTENIARELEELILEKAEGVPFFIEELLRSFKDLDIIKKEGNKFYIAKDVQDVTIPSTIQDVIMARVDSLPEGAKDVLQTGSAIEREFEYELIKRVIGLSEQELLSHLAVLRDSELLYERGIYPQSTYVFKHALTREVVHDSILTRRKKKLHEEVGNAIGEIFKENLDEHYGVLAEHYINSENYMKGADYSIKAGDKAAAVSAWQEAKQQFETALDLLSEEDIRKKADVLQKLANVTNWESEWEISLHYTELAIELYEKLNDKRNLFTMHMFANMLYIAPHWDGGREQEALKHMEAAAAIAEEDPDSQEKGAIYQRTSHIYLHQGEPAQTLIWAQKALDLFTRLNVPMGTSWGTAMTYTGQIDEGIAYNENNCEQALKTANLFILGLVGHELVLTLALVRDIPRARTWGDRIYPHLKKEAAAGGMLRRPLSLVYSLSGEVSKGQEVVEAELDTQKISMYGCYFEGTAGMGLHYLRQGEWNEAQPYLDKAIPLHETRKNFAAVGSCSFVLGCLNMEQGNVDLAEELLTRSLDICRNGGNVLFELWVLALIC
jgi:class 3 adenylate cyclase/tetratricopeptide (TPR) repeat protein